MGKQIIKVQNMHCSSCARMIRMELEEDGTFDLKTKISRIEVTDAASNLGEVELENATPDELALAKALIAGIGSYQVVE